MSDAEDDDYGSDYSEEEKSDNEEEYQNEEEDGISYGSDLDENFENFEEGLSQQGRLQVKNARKLYFDEKQKEYNATIANKVSSQVKDKWKEVMTSHSDGSSVFDFQVLKNLIGAGTTGTLTQQPTTSDQLDTKQRGDDWDYTIGLNHDNPEEEQDEEVGDDEDDEITDED